MRRESIDFHYVAPEHIGVHALLNAWAAWVTPKRSGWPMASIWRLGKPAGRQWHAPELRVDHDEIACMAMERAVAHLPERHRDAIRWCYVIRSGPARGRAATGARTDDELAKLVRQGLGMLTRLTQQ